MGFLDKFRSRGAVEPDLVEAPVRTRTFSASQYRSEELARDAAARAGVSTAHHEASAVLSPAIAPIAEHLMGNAATFGAVEMPAIDEPLPHAPLAAAIPAEPLAPEPIADDPMAYDEAVAWLSQRSPAARNLVAQYWNWNHDLRVLHHLARDAELDGGVAAGVFWMTAVHEDIFPFGDEDPQTPVEQQVSDLAEILGRRFGNGEFGPAAHGFDDSWDCTRFKDVLTDMHDEGRIDWSPEAIPTASSGATMNFGDLPDDERAEVVAFLARHGVG